MIHSLTHTHTHTHTHTLSHLSYLPVFFLNMRVKSDINSHGHWTHSDQATFYQICPGEIEFCWNLSITAAAAFVVGFVVSFYQYKSLRLLCRLGITLSLISIALNLALGVFDAVTESSVTWQVAVELLAPSQR